MFADYMTKLFYAIYFGLVFIPTAHFGLLFASAVPLPLLLLRGSHFAPLFLIAITVSLLFV